MLDLQFVVILTFRPEYQTFDYKEDEERPYVAKSSSAKKTPVSGMIIIFLFNERFCTLKLCYL